MFRDRYLKIIGLGELWNLVNIFKSLRDKTADTKDFRRQSTIPMISVPESRNFEHESLKVGEGEF